METPLEVARIVSEALDTYKEQHPPLEAEMEEIQGPVSVPRIRIRLKTGETFIVDITREPRPMHESFWRVGYQEVILF
jgi:hypothetical protein